MAYTGVSTAVSLSLAFALILLGALFVLESRRLTLRAAVVAAPRRRCLDGHRPKSRSSERTGLFVGPGVAFAAGVIACENQTQVAGAR